jgi:hypothetical protein
LSTSVPLKPNLFVRPSTTSPFKELIISITIQYRVVLYKHKFKFRSRKIIIFLIKILHQPVYDYHLQIHYNKKNDVDLHYAFTT